MTTIRKVRVRGGPRVTCQVTEVESTDNLRTLHGRAVPYDSWTVRGWYQLRMAQGCFDKSIKEAARELPLLLFHDYESFPIGKATNWDSRVDGLWGTWSLDDDPRAQRAARLARDGVLTGLSIGWQPLLQEWEISDLEEWSLDDASTLDRCTLKEGRLAETSLLSTPQFVEAVVASVAAPPPRPPRLQLDRWKSWRDSLNA